MARKILKTNEAARFLGVSRSSLTNWVKQGLLGGGLTPGGHYRFTIEELEAFAEKRGLLLPRDLEGGDLIRILIIEDDEGFREFASEALETFSGYELREAVDGVRGAFVAGTWRPDLIILDIRMPNMNGLEFLKVLRSDPVTESVRVIIVSAHLTPEVRGELNDLGVEMILEKPVRLGPLVAAVERLVNLKIK